MTILGPMLPPNLQLLIDEIFLTWPFGHLQDWFLVFYYWISHEKSNDGCLVKFHVERRQGPASYVNRLIESCDIHSEQFSIAYQSIFPTTDFLAPNQIYPWSGGVGGVGGGGEDLGRGRRGVCGGATLPWLFS